MPEQGKLVTINMFYCEAAVEGVFTIELDNQLSIWMSKHDCWQLHPPHHHQLSTTIEKDVTIQYDH